VNNRVFMEDGTLPPGYVFTAGAVDAHSIRDAEAQALAKTQALAAQAVAKSAGAVPSHTQAAQAVLNTGGAPAHAAIADAIAARTGQAVVAVPPSYAAAPAYVDAHLARSSVQAFWWPPTAVSTVKPITAAAHAVAIAATTSAQTL
jgi:hypothetical protein